MVPGRLRLRSRDDIQRVVRSGKRVVTPYVFIYASPGLNQHSRVACIVSKKVSKSAVRRHRYQRWLRESAQRFLPQMPAPTDMVWVGRPALVNLHTGAELESSLSRLAARLVP